MREPAFWYRPPSLMSSLLAPVEIIYGRIAARRMSKAGARAGIPVFCIGNYHVGGAGKTPTVLALASLLREIGERPFVLSRGYGGRLPGPLSVDSTRHTAAEVGDEPLMMARNLPVVVSRDRVTGAALARSLGAGVVLMDDGFQNPALRKDASIIVIDAARGLGNGRVFPTGPLRAPLPAQVRRTDALVVIGDGIAADPLAAAIDAQGGVVLRASLQPDPTVIAALGGKRVLAFAGIGDPARFFRMLRASGVEVAAEQVFDDHHAFTRGEIDALTAASKLDGLTLVTTEKDWVRLRSNADTAAFAKHVIALPVALRFDDPSKLNDLVAASLHRFRGTVAKP